MSSDKRAQQPDAMQSAVTAEDLDAQSAVELPDREAMSLIQPDPIFSGSPLLAPREPIGINPPVEPEPM
jgi:hypothetical protein